MQVGGKDVKVLTCDSCVKSSKTSCQKESQYSGIYFFNVYVYYYKLECMK